MYRRNILFTDARSHNGVYKLHRRDDANARRRLREGTPLPMDAGYPASATRYRTRATWWGGYGTYWQCVRARRLRLSDTLTLISACDTSKRRGDGYRDQAAAFDPRASGRSSCRARPIRSISRRSARRYRLPRCLAT